MLPLNPLENGDPLADNLGIHYTPHGGFPYTPDSKDICQRLRLAGPLSVRDPMSQLSHLANPASGRRIGGLFSGQLPPAGGPRFSLTPYKPRNR